MFNSILYCLIRSVKMETQIRNNGYILMSKFILPYEITNVCTYFCLWDLKVAWASHFDTESAMSLSVTWLCNIRTASVKWKR